MAGSGCSSSGGDSDVSSSAPSSSCSDDCGDSPRPAADSPPCRPPVRRVPSLSLRANLEDLPRGDAPLTAARTARPQQAAPAPAAAAAQVPPPAQQTAAAAPPRLPPLALGGLPPRRVDLQPSSQTPTALSVDILSPAFNLQRQQQQDGDTSQLALTCAGRLGVQPERLRFYALTEVAGPQQLPPGCSRAAVEVVDSRFSLAALEELVADNHRLAAAGQERGGQQQAAAQVQALQLENDSLRAQLERSEALRRKGARSLQELVQEFNALSRELMKGSTSLDSHMMQAPPHDYARIKAGTPVAVVDGLMLHNGSCDG